MHAIAPEFQKLSQEEVLTALGEGDDNPVTQELGRVLDGLTQEYMRLTRQGLSPQSLLSRKGSCALETFALEMLAEATKPENLLSEG
jgi:hypothetical protein